MVSSAFRRWLGFSALVAALGASLGLAWLSYSAQRRTDAELTLLRQTLGSDPRRAELRKDLVPTVSARSMPAPAAPAAASRPRESAPAALAVPAFADDLEIAGRLQRTSDPQERASLTRRLLDSPFPGSRLAGIRALLRSSPELGMAAIRGLVTGLDPGAPAQAWGAAELAISSLENVPSARAQQELYRFYDSGEPMLRIPAARTLELRGDERPIRELVDELAAGVRSPSAEERLRAVTNLARTRSPTSLSALSPALADRDAEVRLRATQALALVGGGSAIALARGMLGDASPAVRDAAVSALSKLRDLASAAE